jgi:3-oxoacyl-[acyl-carrier protein] reductase
MINIPRMTSESEERMKTVIVTGASRGIGKHLTRRLADAGYGVIGIARRFSEFADFETVPCDVSNAEQVQAVFSEFRKRKDIYGLINCAGVLHTNAVSAISPKEVDEIIDTNLKGTIYCCKNAIRPLLAHGGGRIINFSSIAASSALRGDSVYSASKAAIEVFTRAFAKEVAAKAITVNCVAPGLIGTDMTAGLTEVQIAAMLDLQVIKAQATSEDIWQSVQFLLSQDSTFITGQCMSIGGRA